MTETTEISPAILVIAPDKPSGDAFNGILRGKGLNTEIFYPRIAPRVIGDAINPDPSVERDLARAMQAGYDAGYRCMVIACNTLQLWLGKAEAFLPEDTRKEICTVTTFDAIRSRFPSAAERPVWLGTTPVCRALPRDEFPTLLSFSLDDLQDLVQEIIWRVKGVTGADTRTAPPALKDIHNPANLETSVCRFLDEIGRRNLGPAVLGCTELPIAFQDFRAREKREAITLIDPAEILPDILPDVVRNLAAKARFNNVP